MHTHDLAVAGLADGVHMSSYADGLWDRFAAIDLGLRVLPMGRVHPAMKDRFRASHLQRLLCGTELGRGQS